MKKILAIFAIIAAGALYASDRAEIILERADLMRVSERVDCARDNADYNPAMSPEVSRDMLVNDDRHARDRDYLGTEPRWSGERMRKILTATTEHYQPTIADTRVLIWHEACESTPDLMELRETCDPATIVWYGFRRLDASRDNSEFLQNLDKLKKIIK